MSKKPSRNCVEAMSELPSAAQRIACRTPGADTCGIMRAVSAAESAVPWAKIPA